MNVSKELDVIAVNLQPLHVVREFTMSTRAMDVLKTVQRKYSYEMNKNMSTNKALSLILEHYGQLIEQGVI